MATSEEPLGRAVSGRFIPVKVDLRPPPAARAKRALKWALIVLGVTLFGFGYLGALSGAMAHMQLHLPAQLLGIVLVVVGVALRTRPS
ncbi:MAG: hypothetical protein M0010_10845 [Actinomycetota bacterium]|nr:hypothetical protein [Actinomycetota bacterium]MDA8360125.1 hypothetical protein [Actinomycetota bacterium]